MSDAKKPKAYIKKEYKNVELHGSYVNSNYDKATMKKAFRLMPTHQDLNLHK